MADRPKPRYGWQNQTTPTIKFPVGSQVYITGGRSGIHAMAMLAEVIDFGIPPTLLSHLPDLVHLEIVDPRGANAFFSKGYRDYWQVDQLEPAPAP